MKKFLALALVLALCVGVLPFGALAQEEITTEEDAVIQTIEEWMAEDAEEEQPTEEEPAEAEEPEAEESAEAPVEEEPVPEEIPDEAEQSEETADPVTEVPAPEEDESAPVSEDETEAAPEDEAENEPSEEPVEEDDPEEPETDGSADDELKLDSDNWTKGNSYYTYKAVYCTDPVNSTYQYMNIYVPAAYFSNGTVNGYTADTAPIILENRCEGWNSSTPTSANSTYLNAGYVYVSCGARSRDAENGTGKSPAAVVDLKAAVRWLRLNDEDLPGNSERIISIGSSGGGQMSSILGASGNMSQYYPYLYEIGAAGITKNADGTYTSTISDAIYGCMCSCPIADLDNADIAYAWFFKDSISGQSDFQKQLIQDLAYAYGEYINSMGMVNADGVVLTFDTNADGTLNLRSGTYYDQILQNISDALNAWLDNGGYASSSSSSGGASGEASGEGGSSSSTTYDSADAYIASLGDTSSWLKKNDDDTYSIIDLDAYASAMNYRSQKGLLGFDTWTASAEGNAFGTANEDGVHFSASVAAVLEANYETYSGLSGFSSYKSNVDAYIEQANREDIQEQVYLMNATTIMLNVANGTESADVAPYWRIRTGTSDADTTYNVSYGLAATAAMAGANVDYSLVWLVAHGGDEGTTTGTFADWVEEIMALDDDSLGSTTPSYGGSIESGSTENQDEGSEDDNTDSGDAETGGTDSGSSDTGNTGGPGGTPPGSSGGSDTSGNDSSSDSQTDDSESGGTDSAVTDDESQTDDSAVSVPDETDTGAADDVTSVPDHTPGDVDDDGDVDIADVQALLKYVNKQDVDVNEAALDVDGDGRVDISDVQCLLKYVNKQDVEIF